MIKTIAKLEEWGDSVRILLPEDKLKAEGIAVGDMVRITLRKKR